jgi:hypothetical protein|tara:strand:+ start:4493 stop:5047 length:555 start_codon:yes stop_codon:yes gene_type:complete
MKKNELEFIEKFQEITLDSHKKILDLLQGQKMGAGEINPLIATSIVGLVSTLADLAEIENEGSATYLFKEVEAGIKEGGISKIKQIQDEKGSAQYSISDLEPHDLAGGMNYVGGRLSVTLAEAIHELPLPMRKPEMFLRAIEALLANLLSQKFDASHEVLDQLCEHIHMSLRDLQSRQPLSVVE